MEIVKIIYDFFNKNVTLNVGTELTMLWRQIGEAINAALAE